MKCKKVLFRYLPINNHQIPTDDITYKIFINLLETSYIILNIFDLKLNTKYVKNLFFIENENKKCSLDKILKYLLLFLLIHII